MTTSIATAFTDIMTNITNNQLGSLQTLNQVNRQGGRVRKDIGVITLNSQASATVFGIARIPLLATLLNILAATDTSLGSSTIKFGDSASGNSAIYGAAATLTSTNTYQSYLSVDNGVSAPLTAGYDCTTGAATTYTNDSGAGGSYEDIIMTVGAAALPAAGTLVIVVEYMID